jgi:iron complex transport system ATP-binding protein
MGAFALLQAVDISFGYETASAAADVIRGISCDIARGETVGILGPNGSGKTTLLKLMSGALSPRAGAVRLDGRPLSAWPRRALARRLAVVPQSTSLTFDYSVLEVVLMGRYAHLGAFELEGPRDLAAASAALDATGVISFMTRPFRSLSGGEQQRVIIAAALAQLDAGSVSAEAASPDAGHGDALLVLDEPTASLDLKYQLEVAALLLRLHARRGVTLLVSTHDLRFAAAVCSRLLLLSRGRIVADGPTMEVLTPELVGRVFEIDPEVAAPVLPR